VRRLLQPGLAEVIHDGWAPLSVAPWMTLSVVSGLVICLALALAGARMAGARTGMPVLLGVLVACCALLALLGLASEATVPAKYMLIRDNISGVVTYGPYVNRNHYALGLELTLPAAVAMLAVGVRQLGQPGGAVRRAAALISLTSAVTIAMGIAALLRCRSRGGVLFLVVAAILTLPWWLRPWRARRWPWVILLGLILAGALTLAQTRLPAVQERFKTLFAIEGVDGNSRWDLWAGTVHLWARAPVAGTGLGSLRHAIGMDKPATADRALERSHNDWLEWLATGGLAGGAALALAVGGLALVLWPPRVRNLRFEYRYPMAAAALAVVSTGLHELIGSGLQTPVNRYYLAAWVGVAWGIWASTRERSERRSREVAVGEE
jgi:O-antigen ligase